MGNTIRIKSLLLIAITTVLVLFLLICPNTAFAEDVTIDLYLDGGELVGYTPNESGIASIIVTAEEITLPTPNKLGYTFLGWTKTDNADDTDYVTVLNGSEITASISLYANYSFTEPTLIEHLTDYTDIYNSERTHTLSVEVAHPLSSHATITYQWFKDGALLETASLNSYSVNTVSDSGKYKCVVSFEYLGNTKELTSSEITVDIQKATPSAPIHPILEGIYDPEKTLSDYQLNENYHWKNDTIIPNCTERQYEAEYILGENYNSVAVNITLIVSKAKQVITATDVQAVYDKNAHSIVATATDGAITYSDNNSLTNVGKVTVTVTASETDNYLEATTTAILEVTPKPITAVWNTVIFTYNGEIQLPSYTLDESELSLTFDKEPINAGMYDLIAEVNNSNYTLTNNTLNITIEKQSVNVVWTDREFIYNGFEQMPDYIAKSAEGVILKLNAEAIPTESGEHTVTLVLDEEFAINYSLTDFEHTYIIQKADVDMSNVVFADLTVVYDGLNHRPSVLGLPEYVAVNYDGEYSDPNVYTVTASFTLNNANYNEISPLSATLTILSKTFSADWYEIEFPNGIDPSITVALQMIEDFDGLYTKNNGKLDYLFGFKILFSEEVEYSNNAIIRIRYTDADIDTLVVAVDNNINEQIVTYVYNNNKLEITVNNYQNTYIVAQRTHSIYWIIIPIGIICIVACVIICIITKNHPLPSESNENDNNSDQKVE